VLALKIFLLTDPLGKEHHTWGTSWILTFLVVVREKFGAITILL